MGFLDTWRSINFVGGIEITEIPEDYISELQPNDKPVTYTQAFRSILRGMMLADTPVTLRLERINNKTRVFYLTWAHNEKDLNLRVDSLETTLNAYLPKFNLRRHSEFAGVSIDPQLKGVTSFLLGEPMVRENEDTLPQHTDPMTAASEVLQGLENGILQVFAQPTKSSKSKLRTLHRDYEDAMERSQRVISIPSPSLLSRNSQLSTTLVDARETRRAEQLSRQIKRMSYKYLCKVTVTATHFDTDQRTAEMQSRRVISVLMSGITPADSEEDLRIKISKKDKDIQKILFGKPTGKNTLLTPDEASIFLVLPRCDLGVRVTKRESFPTAAGKVPSKDKVESRSVSVLETRYRNNREPDKSGLYWYYAERYKQAMLVGYSIRNGKSIETMPVVLLPKMLASHVGIYGNTGYGKTTTSVSIVAQAYRNAIVPVILVPDKVDDWRLLKDLYPEFRIFTAGNPEVAPLHINMWDVPPGVPVGKYIDSMVDVHTAALPNDGVISMHFDDVINTMYENCGWSRMGNVRGRPILLSDLYEAVQEVADVHIKYGEEMKRDFYGALDARLRSMLRNDVIVDMYNTMKGLTIPELLKHPTIIEMRDLSPDDRTLLTGILTVGISEYLTANPRKELGHLLVLEEAHHFLKRVGSSTTYAEPTSKQRAIDNIVEMLRTQRGKGLGLILVDQLPSSIAPEAVKLPSNVIIHTLTDMEERVLVGRQALCTDAQIKHIGGMGVGETVVRLMIDSVPRNVQVAHIGYLMAQPIDKKSWTDKMVEEAMNAVYDASPELRESQALSSELKNILKGKQVSEEKPQIVEVPSDDVAANVSEIVESSLFAEQYLRRVKAALSGDTKPIARMLTVVAKKFVPLNSDPIPLAERLLLHAAGVLQEPKDTVLLGDILSAIQVSDA